MIYYDFQDWVHWPECDIRKYARAIAADNTLALEQADHLEAQMALQAGYYPSRPKPFGPFKMDADLEASFRALEQDDAAVFEQNRSMNRPVSPTKDSEYWQDDHMVTVGSGLTRRFNRKILRESRRLRAERRRNRRRNARHPFTAMNPEIRGRAKEAMWRANCYPIGYSEWLIPQRNDAPFEGLVWYARELEKAYFNARDHAQRGDAEAAMWHAFRAGSLSTELGLRMTHGEVFEKYQAVSMAQSDAGKARKAIPDTVRRDAYWRYRKSGHKRTESGRLAGAELGLSEPSIRNAFPNQRYPAD